jgi:hypothetical protein
MSGLFGMHVEHAGFWWGSLKKRSQLEVIGIDVRMNLNTTHGTLPFLYSSIYA